MFPARLCLCVFLLATCSARPNWHKGVVIVDDSADTDLRISQPFVPPTYHDAQLVAAQAIRNAEENAQHQLAMLKERFMDIIRQNTFNAFAPHPFVHLNPFHPKLHSGYPPVNRIHHQPVFVHRTPQNPCAGNILKCLSPNARNKLGKIVPPASAGLQPCFGPNCNQVVFNPHTLVIPKPSHQSFSKKPSKRPHKHHLCHRKQPHRNCIRHSTFWPTYSTVKLNTKLSASTSMNPMQELKHESHFQPLPTLDNQLTENVQQYFVPGEVFNKTSPTSDQENNYKNFETLETNISRLEHEILGTNKENIDLNRGHTNVDSSTIITTSENKHSSSENKVTESLPIKPISTTLEAITESIKYNSERVPPLKTLVNMVHVTPGVAFHTNDVIVGPETLKSTKIPHDLYEEDKQITTSFIGEIKSELTSVSTVEGNSELRSNIERTTLEPISEYYTSLPSEEAKFTRTSTSLEALPEIPERKDGEQHPEAFTPFFTELERTTSLIGEFISTLDPSTGAETLKSTKIPHDSYEEDKQITTLFTGDIKSELTSVSTVEENSELRSNIGSTTLEPISEYYTSLPSEEAKFSTSSTSVEALGGLPERKEEEQQPATFIPFFTELELTTSLIGEFISELTSVSTVEENSELRSNFERTTLKPISEYYTSLPSEEAKFTSISTSLEALPELPEGKDGEQHPEIFTPLFTKLEPTTPLVGEFISTLEPSIGVLKVIDSSIDKGQTTLVPEFITEKTTQSALEAVPKPELGELHHQNLGREDNKEDTTAAGKSTIEDESDSLEIAKVKNTPQIMLSSTSYYGIIEETTFQQELSFSPELRKIFSTTEGLDNLNMTENIEEELEDRLAEISSTLPPIDQRSGMDSITYKDSVEVVTDISFGGNTFTTYSNVDILKNVVNDDKQEARDENSSESHSSKSFSTVNLDDVERSTKSWENIEQVSNNIITTRPPEDSPNNSKIELPSLVDIETTMYNNKINEPSSTTNQYVNEEVTNQVSSINQDKNIKEENVDERSKTNSEVENYLFESPDETTEIWTTNNNYFTGDLLQSKETIVHNDVTSSTESREILEDFGLTEENENPSIFTSVPFEEHGTTIGKTNNISQIHDSNEEEPHQSAMLPKTISELSTVKDITDTYGANTVSDLSVTGHNNRNASDKYVIELTELPGFRENTYGTTEVDHTETEINLEHIESFTATPSTKGDTLESTEITPEKVFLKTDDTGLVLSEDWTEEPTGSSLNSITDNKASVTNEPSNYPQSKLNEEDYSLEVSTPFSTENSPVELLPIQEGRQEESHEYLPDTTSEISSDTGKSEFQEANTTPNSVTESDYIKNTDEDPRLSNNYKITTNTDLTGTTLNSVTSISNELSNYPQSKLNEEEYILEISTPFSTENSPVDLMPIQEGRQEESHEYLPDTTSEISSDTGKSELQEVNTTPSSVTESTSKHIKTIDEEIFELNLNLPDNIFGNTDMPGLLIGENWIDFVTEYPSTNNLIDVTDSVKNEPTGHPQLESEEEEFASKHETVHTSEGTESTVELFSSPQAVIATTLNHLPITDDMIYLGKNFPEINRATLTVTQSNDQSSFQSYQSGVLKFTSEIETTTEKDNNSEETEKTTNNGLSLELNDNSSFNRRVRSAQSVTEEILNPTTYPTTECVFCMLGLPHGHKIKRAIEDTSQVSVKDSQNIKNENKSLHKEKSNCSSSNLEDSDSSKLYASTILELLPVIREGYKNDAFSEEDKKVIRSLFGDMKSLIDEHTFERITETTGDLLMGDGAIQVDDLGEFSDYDSSEGMLEEEIRLKRSKTLQVMNNLLKKFPHSSVKHYDVPTHLKRSRQVRSAPMSQAEAGAILALLTGKETVEFSVSDEDDEEYEFYEDDEYEYEDASYGDAYEDDYDEPSIGELIKLARKHRERKAREEKS